MQRNGKANMEKRRKTKDRYMLIMENVNGIFIPKCRVNNSLLNEIDIINF